MPIIGHQNQATTAKTINDARATSAPQMVSLLRKYPTPNTIAIAGVEVGKTKAKPAQTGAITATANGLIPSFSAIASATGSTIAITAELLINSVNNAIMMARAVNKINGEPQLRHKLVDHPARSACQMHCRANRNRSTIEQATPQLT